MVAFVQRLHELNWIEGRTVNVSALEIRRAEDIAPAIDGFNGRAQALYVCADPLLLANASRMSGILGPYEMSPLASTNSRKPLIVGKRAARAKALYGEGEPADYFYKVLSGTVRTYKVLVDGRRQIGGFYLPGETLGVEAGAEHTFSAEAVTALLLSNRT